RVAVPREIGPDVVEHPVEQHSQPTPVRLLDQLVEVGVGTEPRIDPVVVGGVVAVAARREDRTERQPGGAEVHHMVEPIQHPPEPVFVRPRWPGGGIRPGMSADETERIDLPPDGVAHPVRSGHGRNFRSYSSLMVSVSSAAGPSATRPGATTVTGSGATGPGGAPRSASQPLSCAAGAAWTTRPNPTQACAAAHIGQCSPEV